MLFLQPWMDDVTVSKNRIQKDSRLKIRFYIICFLTPECYYIRIDRVASNLKLFLFSFTGLSAHVLTIGKSFSLWKFLSFGQLQGCRELYFRHRCKRKKKLSHHLLFIYYVFIQINLLPS